MGRIAVAGFFHETNTFSPYPTGLALFEQGGSLPGLTLGSAILERFPGLNVPVSGALARLMELGHDALPIAWASAVPSGTVTDDAFETIAGLIVDRLAAVDALNGIYLDLHGAMVTESHQDAEGELLRRVRAVVGDAVPVVASFDLHANLTEEIARRCNGLTAFRSYPHIDMALTGERAVTLLHRQLERATPFATALRKLPYLVPLHAQSTDSGPAAAIYAEARRLSGREGIETVEFCFGFPPADIADCGPALVVVGTDPAAVEATADAFEAFILAAEGDFAVPLLEPAEAVREAKRLYAGRPVVIADTQDNPGAGGTGDTVGLLRALIEADAQDAVLALLYDPVSARQAHELGVGATATFRLGAHSGVVAESPVEERFTVERLSDGRIVAVGPMFRGNTWNVGATALLRHRGVRVIVTERRLQAADSSQLRHIGLEPEALRIIALKSTVHFRADYAPFAGAILVAVAPGVHLADNNGYAYRRLRDTVRRMPRTAPPA